MVERAETYGAIRKALATLDDPFTRLLVWICLLGGGLFDFPVRTNSKVE